ncbi:MAG: mannonate dehydratase [Terrimicrobiaceae bacterium]
MTIADFLPAKPDRSWKLTQQIGVTHAIVKAAPELTGLNPPWDIDALRTVQRRFEEGGFQLIGLEGDEFDMQRIKLGRPGRDEDLEKYTRMLRNMGELGIPLLCYNFLATIGWCRTATAVPARGGALTNRFDLRELDPTPVPEEDCASEEEMWGNYEYFIRAVMPAADKAGVNMGLHPDDPPLNPLRGIGRIFSNPEGFVRAMALSDSPSHGITFCQANFVVMGADVEACIRRFAPRIKFIHFRDVRGTADCFEETFHDDGPTDMARILKAYHDAGLDVPIRVDHVPTLEGEDNASHGYAVLGRLFAVGYMKGIMDARGIPHR